MSWCEEKHKMNSSPQLHSIPAQAHGVPAQAQSIPAQAYNIPPQPHSVLAQAQSIITSQLRYRVSQLRHMAYQCRHILGDTEKLVTNIRVLCPALTRPDPLLLKSVLLLSDIAFSPSEDHFHENPGDNYILAAPREYHGIYII